jgi:hypothetical protein
MILKKKFSISRAMKGRPAPALRDDETHDNMLLAAKIASSEFGSDKPHQERPDKPPGEHQSHEQYHVITGNGVIGKPIFS